ncbi:MAG: TetR/AcrR family transcriptional regulator [Bacteroidota bacterium]
MTTPPSNTNGRPSTQPGPVATAGERPSGDALRRAILDEARRLLLADGYDSLSMRKIAVAVGCSATSIYLHFASKDALIHALIDEGMATLHRELEQAEAAHADPVERLLAMAQGYVRFGLENAEYYEVMFLLRPEQMARYPAENYRRARRNLGLFAEALAAGAAAGLLDVTRPEVASSVLWASLHGAVSLVMAQRVDVKIPQADFVDEAVRRAVQGFRRAAVVTGDDA